MGDREVKQFNRHIVSRWEAKNQYHHEQRIKDTKSVIDITPPPSFSHLSDRKKIKQKWSDEQARIEYCNMILLQKMRAIMSEQQNKQFVESTNSVLEQGNRGTLNRVERMREMKRILHENEQLLSRIQSRGPTYNVLEWEKDHIQKEKHLSTMGRFPYVSTTLPASIMEELAKPKPIKRYGTTRFPVNKEDNFYHISKDQMNDSFKSDGHHDEAKEESSLDHDGRPQTQPPPSLTPVKASPRRVHHLPSKIQSEEKSNSEKINRRNAPKSSPPKSKSQKSPSKQQQSPPTTINIALSVEHLLPMLQTELLSSGNSTEHIPLPRVILYLRNEAGEYVPHQEIKLESVVDVQQSYKGNATIPAPPELLNPSSSSDATSPTPEQTSANFDRRVRVAIFHSQDPAFNNPNLAPTHSDTIAAPKNNNHLIGEARFSLDHFIHFQKLQYKLKMLKHGAPIAGPSFTGQNPVTHQHNNAVATLSESEIQRRRAMIEPIMILTYVNKPENMQQFLKDSPYSPIQSNESNTNDHSHSNHTSPTRKQAFVHSPPTSPTTHNNQPTSPTQQTTTNTASTSTSSPAQPVNTNEKKLSDFLASGAGRALWSSSSYKPPASLVQSLLSAVSSNPPFLYDYFNAVRKHSSKYPNADTLVAAVSAGLETSTQTKQTITNHLNSAACTVITHSNTYTEEQVEEFLSHCDLALSPLAALCQASKDGFFKRIDILQQQQTDGKMQTTCNDLNQLAEEIKKVDTSEKKKKPAKETDKKPTAKDADKKKSEANTNSSSHTASSPTAAPAAAAPADAQSVLATILAAKQQQEAEVARVLAQQAHTQPTQQSSEDNYDDDEISKPYNEENVNISTSEGQQAAAAAAEAEAKKKAEEEAHTAEEQRKREEAEAAAAAAAAKQQQEAEEAERRKQEEAAKQAAEAERQRKAAEEAAEAERKKKAAEEEEHRKKEELAKQKKLEEEEQAEKKRKQAEEEAAAAAHKKKLEEEQKKREEEEQKRREQEQAAAAAAAAVEEEKKKALLQQQQKEAEEKKAQEEAAAAQKAKEEAAKKSLSPSAAQNDVEQSQVSVSSSKSVDKRARSAELKTRAKEMEKTNANKNFTVSLTVGCKNLPGHGNSAVHPMIALYGEQDGTFAFVSQSEKIVNSNNPVFAEQLVVDNINGKKERAFMFTIYNVANEEDIKEEDVIGTAMISSKELFKHVNRLIVGCKFKVIEIPIVHNGKTVDKACVSILQMTQKEEAAPAADTTSANATASSANAATPAENVEFVAPDDGKCSIYVSVKNIVLPPNVKECNSLAALYVKSV